MKITCAKNGPYLLDDGSALRSRAAQRAGEVALCRCGGSANKPFCDGTHRKNGFSDRNTVDPRENRRVAFSGKGITIFDNRAICAHAGFCTDGLKSVFRMHAEPWIDPLPPEAPSQGGAPPAPTAGRQPDPRVTELEAKVAEVCE